MNTLPTFCAALAFCVVGCDRPPRGDASTSAGGEPAASPATQAAGADVGRVVKSDAEWKQVLSSERYRVLRQRGTEPPFANALNGNHDKGVYACAGCDLELYSSDTKFESGTGWPSFWAPIAAGHVLVSKDDSGGMERDEVLCPRCGGHLGHVFNDGPRPTGLRYCMNSAAMTFKKN